MQNARQTKAALLVLLFGGLCLGGGGLAGILAVPQVVNWGFWMAFAGGVPLSAFALCGLLSERMFANLARR